MSRQERFEAVKERIQERWGERTKFPALKGKVSFEEILHSLIDEITHCEPENLPEFVHRLWACIPNSWQLQDGKFQDEIEEAIQDVQYETPATWCGVVISTDVMASKVETVQEVDWSKVLSACIDLLDRRGLLLEADRMEIMTEEEFDEGEEK